MLPPSSPLPGDCLRPVFGAAQEGRWTCRILLDELMKPGPLPDLVIGKDGRAHHRRRIRLHDLRPLRQLPQQGASRAQGEVHRHRQGASSSCASSRSTTWRRPPRCWRAAPAAARPSRSSPCCLPRQDEWAFVKGDPRPELFKFAKQAGFTQESFDKCLDRPEAARRQSPPSARVAPDTFGVSSTPTFFINGKKLAGADARGLRQGLRVRS